MLRRWIRHDLPVVGVYLLLTLGFTYPLITHFATHVPGTYVDEYSFVWNLWWFKHALFDLGIDPFTSTHTFYPLGVGLAFYTLAIFNDILALPLMAFFDIIVASNAIIVLSFTLAGYGAFLLVKYLLMEDKVSLSPSLAVAAALLAGVVYAFPASRFIYLSLGHYNIVSVQWIPFYILFFIKAIQGTANGRPKWQEAVLAGLFLSLALLTEYTYGVFLLLFSLLWLAFTPKSLLFRLAFWRQTAILGLAALVPFAPVLYFMMREIGQGEGFHFPGWGYADLLSADLVGLFTPTGLHPFWGQAFQSVRAQFTDVNTVFLGYAVPLLALLALLLYRRRVLVWAVGAASSLILSLGPVLHSNGQYLFDLDGLTVTVPLPFIVFHYLPFFNMNRVPNRFSVLLALCLAVLIGYAAYWMFQVLRSRFQVSGRFSALLFAALFILVVFENLSAPIPLTDARIPAIYRQIAQDPGDFAILPLPLGWRESFRTMGAELTQVQYYQTVHGKRLINGNASRLPGFKFDYFGRIDLLKSIVDLEMYQEVDAARRQRDRDSAAEVLYFFDIRYVVFHPAIPGRVPYSDTITRTEEYVRQVLFLEPAFDQDGVAAYRVIQPPAKTEITVDFGAPPARLYQGEGWGDDEGGGGGPTYNWATAQGARFFIPLRLMGDYRLSLSLLPFGYPGGPAQTVTLRVNGRPLPQALTLAPAWTPYEVTIPADYLKSGLNEIALDFAYVASPRQVLTADYSVGQTGVKSPLEITVQSAAGFASIQVAEKEVSPGGVGYNLVVLDPASGRVLAAQSFNTGAEAAQSAALADFVAAIPSGRIVAVAGRGQAGDNLSAAAIAALGSLGLNGDLRAAPGRVHAAVGVKGAAPGQALEQAAEGFSFVHLGPNADKRTLAAAVDFVKMTKVEP